MDIAFLAIGISTSVADITATIAATGLSLPALLGKGPFGALLTPILLPIISPMIAGTAAYKVEP